MVRRETTLGEALEALCQKELEEREPASAALLGQYVKTAAELLTEYGPLSDAPTDRYTDGRLDDLLGEEIPPMLGEQ